MHGCGSVVDVFGSLLLDVWDVAGFARRGGRVRCYAVVQQFSLRLLSLLDC